MYITKKKFKSIQINFFEVSATLSVKKSHCNLFLVGSGNLFWSVWPVFFSKICLLPAAQKIWPKQSLFTALGELGKINLVHLKKRLPKFSTTFWKSAPLEKILDTPLYIVTQGLPKEPSSGLPSVFWYSKSYQSF